MHRLSLGLLISDEWAKYVSIISPRIAVKLSEINDTILGTSIEDLSKIQFRLVDINIRKKLKTQVKDVAELITRCSLAIDKISSSSSILDTI